MRCSFCLVCQVRVRQVSCSGMRLGEADSHVAVQVGVSWVSMWVGIIRLVVMSWGRLGPRE